MTVRYARWIVRWRYLVLALVLLAVGVAGSGVQRLHFDNDYRVFFSVDNPQLLACRHEHQCTPQSMNPRIG